MAREATTQEKGEGDDGPEPNWRSAKKQAPWRKGEMQGWAMAKKGEGEGRAKEGGFQQGWRAGAN